MRHYKQGIIAEHRKRLHEAERDGYYRIADNYRKRLASGSIGHAPDIDPIGRMPDEQSV